MRSNLCSRGAMLWPEEEHVHANDLAVKLKFVFLMKSVHIGTQSYISTHCHQKCYYS